MTKDDVLALIQGGETFHVEFKSDYKDRLGDSDIYANVVCLANAEGGVLLIGVENDGTITGLNAERKLPIDPIMLQAAIFNNTAPPISTTVSEYQFEKVSIIAIEVNKERNICATSGGLCVRRVMGVDGPRCLPYYPYQHQSRLIELGLEDLTARVIEGTRWDDLDPWEFLRLREFIKNSNGDQKLLQLDDLELAKALKLVETRDDGVVPVVAGLLLVGRESSIHKYLRTNRTAFQVRDDTKAVVNESLDYGILRQISELDARYEARKNEQEILIGMTRMAIPAYSKEAYREAINNALIHRDYTVLDKVHIQWTPDHLLITNPGSFPPGITKDNLLTHEPKPRNPRLAEACQRIGIVESMARGVDKIYLGQLKYGRPLPDYSRSDNDAVRLIIRGGIANLAFVRFIHEQEIEGHKLNLDELIALNQLQYERTITVEQLKHLIQKDERDARRTLERLVECGFIETRGRRNREYILSANVYRALGKTDSYIRMIGVDQIRQEGMVIEFIKHYGGITRGDVIKLCSITDNQAKVLLRKMHREGKLAIEGSRRASRYVIKNNSALIPISGKELTGQITEMLKKNQVMTLQEMEDNLNCQGYEVAGQNKRNYLTGIVSRNKALYEGLGHGKYRLREETSTDLQ